MENFIFIISSLYLLSVVPQVFSKTLDSSNSFVDHFSIYLNNLFNENLFKTNIRKVRSNSDQNFKWNEFNTKHSFTEIPVLGVKSKNKTSLWSEKSINQTSKELATGDHLFAPDASIDRLKRTAENLFATTRNSGSNKSDKVYVQQKIYDEFKTNNLIVENQIFVTSSRESNTSLEGINIIGIFPGIHWGADSSKDRILVIGAHYDTVDKTDGVNDNGSGMTALLEIIRLININNCQLIYTLIFVAFDLEELGALGSKYFVNHYLIPNQLIEKKSDFEGAIILDTILNFNQSLGSQDIPYDVHRALPQWSQQIRGNGFVGDFLALISRQNIDDRLSSHIRNSWNSMSGRTPYKLSQMTTNSLDSKTPDLKTLSNHANLLRSDHIMFWYHNNTLYNQTLKAVLITDTGPFRGYMRDCYHISCDDRNHLNDQNLKFLKLTAEVLTQTAVKLTLGKCH